MTAGQHHAARLGLRDGTVADRVLALLTIAGPLYATDLCDRLNVGESSMRRTLTALVAGAAVERHRERGWDGRGGPDRAPWEYRIVPISEHVDIRIDLSAVTDGPVA